MKRLVSLIEQNVSATNMRGEINKKKNFKPENKYLQKNIKNPIAHKIVLLQLFIIYTSTMQQ